VAVTKPPQEARKRLQHEPNIWLASSRPDGKPHLVPIWFIWNRGRFYLCIESRSVKAHNVRNDRRVSLALEDGSNPVICEGEATTVPPPWPSEIIRAFSKKYDWDISPTDQYDQLIRVEPQRWLRW
jgi:nitroimidazol reductase NimA-like FMN-containing flavoprotein (pyridoxamine 5'-phosphate oxidase superfamily)